MGILFGTDGIRGVAGEELTSRTAFALGNALSRMKQEKREILTGKRKRKENLIHESP